MEILIVSQYYYPEQFQINEIAPELVRRGYNVTILCGLPNYPKGEIYPGYDNPSRLSETIDGVHIIRVKQKPRGQNVISLVRNYISFVRKANKVLENLNRGFDVVLGYQLSPVTSMLPAVKYSNTHSTPLLLYILDIWPVSAREHLILKNGIIYHWLHRLSKRIYTAADRLLVTSRPFIDYMHTVNDIEESKMAYLPQHADKTMLDMDLTNRNTAKVNFMFAGNMGTGATLDVIVKASNILGPREDYTINFVGDGSQRKRLEKLVSEMGLNRNFIFHGNQQREKMPNFYKMADVLLITLRGNNEVGNTMPGKLQMYMTTGKPIIGAINGAAAEVITDAKCGKCVAAGDYKGLAGLMKEAIENPERYVDCGKNAKRYFLENFTLKSYVDRLEEELKKLVKCN